MRVYANLIKQNWAIFDQPIIKYDQIKIFKCLLVYDQVDDDDFASVLEEAGQTSLMADPSFNIFFDRSFEKYIEQNRHHAKWQKIKKDYNYYAEWEIKRRNKNNPYYFLKPDLVSTWDDLPSLERQKKNEPYQFDKLYQDSEVLAGSVYELTKNYKELKDKDLFRAKVNSILVPNKIVFAINSSENSQDFSEGEIMVVNIKLSMDAYKLADIYLNRLVDSLHKISWSHSEARDAIEGAVSLANKIKQRIGERIVALERSFMLYIEADFGEEQS
ncbi:MAG: hypothetical protein JWO40_477 [Candidatus Doudnabacteria bacterium]|nr:hypothetical protein [Candidatus Doudnabacteria bacterium]